MVGYQWCCSKSQRSQSVFEQTKERLAEQGLFTWPTIFGKVAEFFDAKEEKPFTHAVIDEAQDLGVPELKMLSAITPRGPNSLFFAGDLGQRIFQEPFSWKALGIDRPFSPTKISRSLAWPFVEDLLFIRKTMPGN